MTDHPIPVALIDLAAGRAPREIEWTGSLVRAAGEHRMTGLLWTWAADHAPDGEVRSSLAMSDLRVQAHLQRVWRCLEESVGVLRDAGFEVATIKGVTAQARWYARPGERLCSDVDLVLPPGQLDRVGEAVAALQPDHPWVEHVDALVAGGLQAVTLHRNGLEVDLHFDVLKLGIASRIGGEIWDATLEHPLPGGGSVRVLDETAALLHFLVHLNKDRFQRLSGYADVARVLATGRVDWVRFRRLCHRDGIETAVGCSLDVVVDELGLPWPPDVPRPTGPRARIWRGVWPARMRLRGRVGRLRFRRRQDMLAFLARGRALEAVRWWLRDVFPPPTVVHTHYADLPGPYLWKLLRGRLDGLREQRDEVRAVAAEREGSAPGAA